MLSTVRESELGECNNTGAKASHKAVHQVKFILESSVMTLHPQQLFLFFFQSIKMQQGGLLSHLQIWL